MNSTVRITLNNLIGVGSITFLQPGLSFAAARTAFGFRLQIPANITFSGTSGSTLPLLLENLGVTFHVTTDRGTIEIGTAHCTETLHTGSQERAILFPWDWLLPTLSYYERLRDGKEPTFRLDVSGSIRYVLPGEPGRAPCSMASFFDAVGHIRYSREAWTKMMRELNLRDSILLEIPFPSDPPSGWEPIWDALREARDSFDTGGSTGWKSAVTSVRLALEKWQDIEKEDQGPGWKRPDRSDLENRSKMQRMDSLRWHLIQLAHYAAHTKADEWTRDDAQLMLSTLCSLLAVRKP